MKVKEFIEDYQSMDMWDFVDKWQKQYDDIPRVKDLVEYLKANNNLSLLGQTEAQALREAEIIIGTIVANLPR